MNYQIIWDIKTRDFLKKIDRIEAKRIIKKVNSIVNEPKHYLKSLVGIKSRKLRIGDYRALIDLDEKNKILNVIFIGHRKNIYNTISKLKEIRNK